MIFSERETLFILEIGVLKGLWRKLPVKLELGVTLPLTREGVTRPPVEGVALPFENEADGVREVV